MKAQTLTRVSGMILLAMAVGLAVFALVYILQYPNIMPMLTTVSWNG